ncbi:MAG: twin-arginine translocation signal domain-containing protein, partial [Polaromonas sp.]|nr:twin-arginine translocation signal domain-containing protein [Polaromonas sp.]
MTTTGDIMTNRRQFIQASAATAVLSSMGLPAFAQ